MITREELIELIQSDETARIEKTESTTNNDKFCEAICSFANDMPNTRQNGYLLIGVTDNGKLNGLKVTDELQLKISAIRSDGNILPIPSMNVYPFHFKDGDVLVVEVSPSIAPPVRYKGKTCIRIGPRKGYATKEEEQILSERSSLNNKSFDIMPCREAKIDDIDVLLFEKEYLPKAIDDDAEDNRSVKEKMAALRLYDMKYDCPTYASIILFGKNPKYFLMGDYIQFLSFDGVDNAADINNEYEFNECLVKMLPKLDTFIETSISKKRPISISALREKITYKYPLWAIRELLMNAVMHRNYQTNTPTKFYQYNDRLEIINPGGLYGNANADNFPNVNDYRNPVIAEAMKILGYVNKYNRGIARVNSELQKNGNGEAHFNISKLTVFEVIVKETQDNKVSNQDNILEDNTLHRLGNQVSNQGVKFNLGEELARSILVNSLESKKENVDNREEFFHLWANELTTDSKEILYIALNPKSKNEIFLRLGMSKQTKNAKKYLRPLIKLGLLETTVKDKLTSPHQKYFTSLLGKKFIEYLESTK